MTEKIQNILRGAGSVLFPTQSARSPQKLYHPSQNAKDSLRGDWERVGRDLTIAIKKTVNEQR
jgi:hypothetical protein